MKKIFWLCLILAFCLAFGVAKIEYAQAGVLDFFYDGSRDELKVEGNQVLLNGSDIYFRGVAVGDPHSRETNDRRSIDDYLTIKRDWQANIVRLSVHPGVFKMDEKDGKKYLEKEVEAAREQGLMVIIDWHVIGVPNGWYKPSDWGEQHYYSYDSNFNTARDFWKYVAIKYRNDQGVIFELWNEPADENRDEKWHEIKPYMDRLYGIIRSNGAKNIIIMPGVWWTYDLRDIKYDRPNGDNIAFAWHNYPGNRKMYIDWDSALDNLEKEYPIFVTEWGFTDEQSDYYDEYFVNNFSNYLIERGLHFTAWCWHGSWNTRMFYRNWQDLTTYGKYVKNFLSNLVNIEEAQDKINNFLYNGVDYNTWKLGEGERRAVLYSFQVAFGRYPTTGADYEDVVKIASGNWPNQRSDSAENKAKENFHYIYRREADMNNSNDNAAITVMAYGLRQRAENRNLDSERQGIGIFRNIYGRVPSSTEDWNIMQAITYSGARR